MFKPLYLTHGRAILRVNKIVKKGEENYDLEKTGTVLSSTLPELKRGTVVVPIIRGGVPIASEETKKVIVFSIDVEDLYAAKI